VLAFLSARTIAHGVEPAAMELTPGEREIHKHLPGDDFELTMIRLWPDEAPDELRRWPEEVVAEGKRASQIRFVTQPSITVARPKDADEPTPVLIVCPGGGYGGLGVTLGGVDVIRWLKPRGVTGVYMKYRVPKRHGGFAQHHHALQDMQRAMCLLRSRADELRIDPKRIGVIGFSAGGHLTAMISTNHQPEHRLYPKVDDADDLSCRPDFAAMVAPAYLTMPILSDQLDPALHADAIARHVTPPTFIASAITDKFTVGSLHYFLLLREKHIEAESHIYERGGHAEGIHDGPDNQWPAMFEDWLRRRGMIASPDVKP
jgi:acetyl esterase/lipase